MGITKTDFMRGMQCRKMLWLDRHKPQYRVIPPETRARLDAGNVFGDRAMGMFGPYEEMTVYLPGTRIPPVICEAAFLYYNNYCAADILKKTDAGYDLYEVKNTGTVKDQFIRDAAFQYYIMDRCKVRIHRIYIVLHGPDENNPFVPEDITEQAKALAPWINDHIWDLNRMWKQQEEPEQEPGEQCTCPYECWYYAYCHNARPEQIRMDILKGETTMSERKADKAEKEWSDEIPDDEEEIRPEPYEETYQDGTPKNECWKDR